MIAQGELKEILNYRPSTGEFFWKNGRLAGSFYNNQYVYIQIKGKRYLAHRLAFLYVTGEIPDYVDHKDGNSLNNKWLNLRSCTLSENQYNKKIQSNNTSGIKGVCWYSRSNKWMAYINHKGKRIRLGYHDKLR